MGIGTPFVGTYYAEARRDKSARIYSYISCVTTIRPRDLSLGVKDALAACLRTIAILSSSRPCPDGHRCYIHTYIHKSLSSPAVVVYVPRRMSRVTRRRACDDSNVRSRARPRDVARPERKRFPFRGSTSSENGRVTVSVVGSAGGLVSFVLRVGRASENAFRVFLPSSPSTYFYSRLTVKSILISDISRSAPRLNTDA